jgi:hypothetical protein
MPSDGCALPLSDLPPELCNYVLAKLIIFCILGGWACLYAACAAPHVDRRGTVRKLCLAAVAFELIALLIAYIYAAFVLFLAIEVASSLILCACCCVTAPLVCRAQARGALGEHSECDMLSSRLLCAACAECGHLLVRAASVAEEDDAIDPQDREVALKIRAIAAAVRMGVGTI